MSIVARISDFVIPGDHGPNQRQTWVAIPGPVSLPLNPTYFLQILQDRNGKTLGVFPPVYAYDLSYPPSAREEILSTHIVDEQLWYEADGVVRRLVYRKRVEAVLRQNTFLSSKFQAAMLVRDDEEDRLTQGLVALIEQLNATLPECHDKAIHYLD